VANNRIWIQVKSYPEKRFLLAKYYPSTGWYCFHSQEKIDNWLDENVNEDRSLFGATNLELKYESNSLEELPKRTILSLLEKEKGEDEKNKGSI